MDPYLPDEMRSWFEIFLLWVGFGTCVGLLAKGLMPGRDPGGAIATLLMGITGVIIGCGVYYLIYDERVSPITSVGLVCGTLGALMILLFYRMLGGFLLDEAGSSSAGRRDDRTRARRRPRRRRRYQYPRYIDE